jgi:uncharacterized protein YuzE
VKNEMKVRIDPHTLEQMVKRGTSEDEIIEVLNSEKVEPAKRGRFKKSKVFSFNDFWCNKFYLQKKVEVIYTIEQEEIVTVTVFYILWILVMKIVYNTTQDLLHIVFRESGQVRNERYNDDIVFDVDSNNKIVGMEILDASNYLDAQDIRNVKVIEEKAA